MMIAIALVSMAIGCILGYKVGFHRCAVQATAVLEMFRKRTSK